MTEGKIDKKVVEDLFAVGAHYGGRKSRRHPSTAEFIFGTKDNVQIFNLEQVAELTDTATAFVEKIAQDGKQILFVSGKQEAKTILKDGAMKIDQPFVAGRFIGGTLTNFEQIRKRVDTLIDFQNKKEKGELAQYTKRERLMIDRQIEKLGIRFGGLTDMTKRPGAVFVIDPNHEHIAVAEAKKEGIPVIALAGSDCDITGIQYPIVANDSSVHSIKHFVQAIVTAYESGKKARANSAETKESTATTKK